MSVQGSEVEYRGELQKQRSPEVEFGGSCLAMAACVVQGVLNSRLLVPGAQALLPQHSSLSCGRVLEEPYHQSSVRAYSRALTSDVSSSGIERWTSAPRIGVSGRSRPVSMPFPLINSLPFSGFVLWLCCAQVWPEVVITNVGVVYRWMYGIKIRHQ